MIYPNLKNAIVVNSIRNQGYLGYHSGIIDWNT